MSSDNLRVSIILMTEVFLWYLPISDSKRSEDSGMLRNPREMLWLVIVGLDAGVFVWP